MAAGDSSGLPTANSQAAGTLTDNSQSGSSTTRRNNSAGISPTPSETNHIKSSGRSAAHLPGSKATANPSSVVTTHAAASAGGKVGVPTVIVMAGMPKASGMAANRHTCRQVEEVTRCLRRRQRAPSNNSQRRTMSSLPRLRPNHTSNNGWRSFRQTAPHAECRPSYDHKER